MEQNQALLHVRWKRVELTTGLCPAQLGPLHVLQSGTTGPGHANFFEGNLHKSGLLENLSFCKAITSPPPSPKVLVWARWRWVNWVNLMKFIVIQERPPAYIISDSFMKNCWTNFRRVLLCFIDPRVRKIRTEAFSCPGIFSRTLRFYYVASSPGSPLSHLLDGHRKLVGSSAIPASPEAS